MQTFVHYVKVQYFELKSNSNLLLHTQSFHSSDEVCFLTNQTIVVFNIVLLFLNQIVKYKQYIWNCQTLDIQIHAVKKFF